MSILRAVLSLSACALLFPAADVWARGEPSGKVIQGQPAEVPPCDIAKFNQMASFRDFLVKVMKWEEDVIKPHYGYGDGIGPHYNKFCFAKGASQEYLAQVGKGFDDIIADFLEKTREPEAKLREQWWGVLRDAADNNSPACWDIDYGTRRVDNLHNELVTSKEHYKGKCLCILIGGEVLDNNLPVNCSKH